MKIQAYAAFAPGVELKPFTYVDRELKPFEILVQITHCGLCHTDLFMIENSWNRSTYPLVPGHEIVGLVVKTGKLATKDINGRVGIGWIHSTCLHCPECANGETNICQNKSSIYSNGKFGGFANYVIADSRYSYLIPENLPSAFAAPLLCAGATVFSPLKKFKGKDIGIIGIGGLGHLAVQFAKALGNRVTAISHSSTKKEDALKLGACNFYTFENPPKPNSLDYILCTSDADLNWNQILTWLKPNGVLCFVSRPPNGISIDPKYFVSTQKTITGSNNANSETMNEMLSFAAENKIYPWIEEMPLTNVNEAIQKLKAGKVRYRIVFHL